MAKSLGTMLKQITTQLPLSPKKRRELEDHLFALGAMKEAPCFCCGYNGPGYYQPDTHLCAARHHKLYQQEE